VERKAGGFASFAERTVSRDWKQSTWGLISKYWILHFVGEIWKEILNLGKKDVKRWNGKLAEFGRSYNLQCEQKKFSFHAVRLCTFKPTCIEKIKSCWPVSFFVQFCTVWLEWHPVNIIHHQISGDLMMNHKNDWTSECIFFKEDASKERNDM